MEKFHINFLKDLVELLETNDAGNEGITLLVSETRKVQGKAAIASLKKLTISPHTLRALQTQLNK